MYNNSFFSKTIMERTSISILAILIGIVTVYLGSFSLAISLIPMFIILLVRIKLTSKTATLLIITALLVNFLRPLGIFPLISLSVDFLIFFLVVKELFIKGIPKERGIWIGLSLTFICLSFIEIFNPNVPSFMAGLEGFRKTSFAWFYFCLGLLAFNTSNDINKLFNKLSLYSLPILLFGIKQFFMPSSLDALYLQSNSGGFYTGNVFGLTRATSVFASPFHLGTFAAAMVIINLFLFTTSKNMKNKIFYCIATLISFLACYSSLTRTNLIAMLVAIIVYLFFINIRRVLLILPLVVVIFYFLYNFLFLVVSFSTNTKNPLLKLIASITTFSDDNRLLARVEGWEEIPQLISKQPFIAYGTGSAGDTLGSIYNFQYHVTSHNFFLKVLMETGVIGFLIIAFIIIASLIIMIRKILRGGNDSFIRKINVCCFSIFVIFIVNTPINSTIEMNPISGIILLVVAISIKSIKNEEQYVHG